MSCNRQQWRTAAGKPSLPFQWNLSSLLPRSRFSADGEARWTLRSDSPSTFLWPHNRCCVLTSDRSPKALWDHYRQSVYRLGGRKEPDFYLVRAQLTSIRMIGFMSCGGGDGCTLLEWFKMFLGGVFISASYVVSAILSRTPTSTSFQTHTLSFRALQIRNEQLCIIDLKYCIPFIFE